jgi:hypothetical protein
MTTASRDYDAPQQTVVATTLDVYDFTHAIVTSIHSIHTSQEARGSVVVKALCYKPEGLGFDT